MLSVAKLDTRTGALLRALRRRRNRRLLRRPRRVTRHLDRQRRRRARARRRRRGRRSSHALIRGDNPLTGENLRRRHPKARTITVEKIDPASGERRLRGEDASPGRRLRPRLLRPPKSVSLLHALGDEQTRRAVNEAHTTAWQAALAYLEDEACVVRRGTGGVAREHGEGFVAAAYQHRTSRAQDPHLHTHVIVANMARRPSDGKWRALDGEAILKTYRLAAGYLYQAHLRGELSRRSGSSGRRAYKGLADLKGVAREVIDAVLDPARTGGRAHGRATARAASGPRRSPRSTPATARSTSTSAGCARSGAPAPPSTVSAARELDAVMHRAPWREPSSRELLEIARDLLGPKGLTERSTAFSDPDLVMAWSEAHAQGASAERVRRLAARFVGMNGVEPVGEAAQPGRPARYSTRELLDVRARRARARRARHRLGRAVRSRRDRSRPPSGRHPRSRRSRPRCCGPSPRARIASSASSGSPAAARRPPHVPSQTPSGRRASPCSALHLQASRPRSCKTRPAFPRRPSTGSSSSRSPSAASSSSTRPEWPRPASSPRCSNASSRRRRRSS